VKSVPSFTVVQTKGGLCSICLYQFIWNIS